MIVVSIALNVIILYSKQFIGKVIQSCIHFNIVIDGIITKLQYTIYHIKIDINRVLYVITSILSLELHESIVID